MSFADVLTDWYAGAARDLPWRRAGTSAWGVLVSEVMLQQTPVARVAPAWAAWMDRWPRPADLAVEPAGEAIRAWGRLGYPRRALRLHAAARAIVDRHDGRVPADPAALRALPGVGDYTAAAVAAFAFGGREPVLDTNVRRVYARVFAGVADAAGSPTIREREAARQRLPAESAATYSVSVMELGALVCTARSPQCQVCPARADCRWLAAGRPAASRPRPAQRYAGTDRQVRGRLLAVLRAAAGPVRPAALRVDWPDPAQRARALDALVTDGLVEVTADGRFRLPA